MGEQTYEPINRLFNMPNPTPKPTTEEWADKVLAERDEKVRAKAFEEAAEVAENSDRAFGTVWGMSGKEIATDIRALAKGDASSPPQEQPDARV